MKHLSLSVLAHAMVLVTSITTLCIDFHPTLAPLFDTSFLSTPTKVADLLINQEGFISGFFTTPDGYSLSYLYKKQPHARCTVICCGGFWPGRKEGMATMYALLASDCNLLLFDARGHGTSDGFYYSLWRYGLREYQDILGAIQCAYDLDAHPLILHGFCAGAFNAMHACTHLDELEPQQAELVRGVICDSGWASVADVSYTALKAELRTQLRKLLKSISSSCKHVLFAMGSGCISACSSFAHTLVLRPLLNLHREQTNLLKRVPLIDVPILYIHAYDDAYVDISVVQELASLTQHPHYWWITEPSTHAAHHLKYSDTYKRKITQFLQNIL